MRAKDWAYLVLCVLLTTAIGLFIPQTVKVLTSQAVFSGNGLLIASAGAFLLCTVLSVYLMKAVNGALVQRIRGKTSLTVHSALMMRILRLPSDFFERVSPGELAGFSSAVDELCEQLITATAGTELSTLASLLYIVQIFFIAPPLFIRLGGVITLAVSLISAIVLYSVAAEHGVGTSAYIAFAVAYGAVIGAIRLMSDSFLSVGRITPALQMLDTFLQTEPETAGSKKIVSQLSGAVELNNVFFRYSENTPYVLNNLSLKIRPGEYVAVVGKTGCGKSTLIKLLLSLRKPERGEMAYDGHNLGLLDLSSLRQKIGTVMQNGQLFQGSIFENITIASPKATICVWSVERQRTFPMKMIPLMLLSADRTCNIL